MKFCSRQREEIASASAGLREGEPSFYQVTIVTQAFD